MYRNVAVLLILLIIFLAIYVYMNKHGNTNIFEKNIYLDNNGTTQMAPEALEAYNKYAYLGNASASYAHEAKNIIDKHDKHVADVLGVQYRVIHTSGASESNNTVLKALAASITRPHFVLSSYEHKTSIDCVKQLVKDNIIELTLVNPNMYGTITIDSIKEAIRPNTVLVSIMHINNETGNVNDISLIAAEVKKINANIIVHSDIVQSYGKYTPNLQNVDAISASYHKIYGPQGTGILALNSRVLELVKNHPLIHGEQNFGARGGTLNAAGIAASCEALTTICKNREKKNAKLFKMKKYVIDFLKEHYTIDDYINYYNKPDDFIPAGTGMKCVFMGENPLSKATAPNTLLIAFIKPGTENHFCNVKLKKDLMSRNIITSIGSTCHSASKEPSHVMYSLKAPFVIRCGVLRISLGDYNKLSDVKKMCNILKECVNQQL
jgi:cysteine desulfurase